MKKRFCQIFGVVVFLVIGIFIFACISEVLRAKTASNQDTDMIHSLYKLEEDSIDVLVLGSSLGYSSIQPNTLWHDYGITSFCMCSPSQAVPTSYYLLLEALKYQKPKVVVLESFCMYLGKKYSKEARLRQAIDGVRLGKVKYEALNDLKFTNEKTGLKDQMSYYIPFLMYHSRWNELTNYDFHPTGQYLKGSIHSYDVAPIEDPGLSKIRKKIPKVSRRYLNKIKQTCDENGIQLVVYAAPFGVLEGNVEMYERWIGVTNTLETYLAKRDIPFLYYQKIPEAGIDFATDFRNATHMNTYGAVKLSRHLGAYLTQQFDMEDHREDPAYESWNKDYEKYRSIAGENEKSA